MAEPSLKHENTSTTVHTAPPARPPARPPRPRPPARPARPIHDNYNLKHINVGDNGMFHKLS